MVMQVDAQKLKTIIIEAGTRVLAFFDNSVIKIHKAPGDFTTHADIASEQYLIKELSALLPEASFHAEESGISGEASDYCWVIDPLDGTTNFYHGFPYFCISVALTYKGVPQVAVIYQPLSNELFYAQIGEGAWLNDEPLTMGITEPARALLLVGPPYEADAKATRLLQQLVAVNPAGYVFRHTGSLALDCAYLAAGKADGMFVMGVNWWDVAAGLLIIQEAGGTVTMGKNDQLLVAGSSAVHQDLMNILNTQV